MSGLVGMGREQLHGAMQGGASAAAREKERNMANEQLDQAEKAQRTNAQMSGMGMGAMAGAQYGAAAGPWGMVAGAAIGFLAGSLFG